MVLFGKLLQWGVHGCKVAFCLMSWTQEKFLVSVEVFLLCLPLSVLIRICRFLNICRGYPGLELLISGGICGAVKVAARPVYVVESWIRRGWVLFFAYFCRCDKWGISGSMPDGLRDVGDCDQVVLNSGKLLGRSGEPSFKLFEGIPQII